MIMFLLSALQTPEPFIVTRTPRIERVAKPCTVSPVQSGVQLMIIGHYEGSALSTAWLKDPDTAINAVDIDIQPGSPVHLVITGYGETIYRFSGATDRVRHLTLMSSNPVGAVGIQKSLVAFAPAHCLNYSLIYGADHARREQAIVALYGRAAKTGGAYSFRSARIGEDISLQAPRYRNVRADPETEQLMSFSPGGVMRIEPRTIVSADAAGSYAVLPQEAGVRQLVRSGALVVATKADALSWETKARQRGAKAPQGVYGHHYGIYRVTRPIIVPSGLCGSHSVSFYVPSPAFLRGDPCHSRLYFDDGTAQGPGLSPE